MRKFYTALAVGVAFSLSAVAATHSRPMTFVPAEDVNLETMTFEKVDMKKSYTLTDGTRAAADMATDYEMLYYCNLLTAGQGSPAIGYIGAYLQVKPVEGGYVLGGLAYDFEATVTLGENTVSIAPQTLGTVEMQGTEYRIDLIHKRWNDNGQGNYDVPDPFVISYDAEYGDYSANQMDLLGVVAVEPTSNQIAGYFFMGYGISWMKLPSTLASEDWKSAGTAKFTDGFVSPGFTQDGSAVSWDVPVEVSVKNPDLLRLMNPYGKGIAPDELVNLNGSQVPGSIVMNIANKDNVYVIPGFYSGMYVKAAYFPIYAVNLPGYYRYYEDMSDEDIIDGFGEDELSSISGKTITIRQSMFGDTPYFTMRKQDGSTFNTEFPYYSWEDAAGNEILVDSVIELPNDLDSVEEIGAEDMNAPVKYYNLQGVEIAAPAKGELVIKKQGAKATKAIVR